MISKTKLEVIPCDHLKGLCVGLCLFERTKVTEAFKPLIRTKASYINKQIKSKQRKVAENV